MLESFSASLLIGPFHNTFSALKFSHRMVEYRLDASHICWLLICTAAQAHSNTVRNCTVQPIVIQHGFSHFFLILYLNTVSHFINYYSNYFFVCFTAQLFDESPIIGHVFLLWSFPFLPLCLIGPFLLWWDTFFALKFSHRMIECRLGTSHICWSALLPVAQQQRPHGAQLRGAAHRYVIRFLTFFFLFFLIWIRVLTLSIIILIIFLIYFIAQFFDESPSWDTYFCYDRTLFCPSFYLNPFCCDKTRFLL